MKLWNIGKEKIKQLHDSMVYIFEPGTETDVPDIVGTFMLSKKNVRGKGLVQLKPEDKRQDRYNQGRLNIYNWNVEIRDNYEKHCEERAEVSKLAIRPHEAVVQARVVIEQYEKWIEEGKPVSDEIKKSQSGLKTVYACPYCSREFTERIAYFGHLRTHQKENKDVHSGATKNKSPGKG